MYTRTSTFTPAYAATLQGAEAAYAKELKLLVMRRLTWLLIIAYSFMLLRPAMPVVADVMAHTFNERQHMLTVHEVNGRFHVHNEVLKNSGGSDKNRSAIEVKVVNDEYLPVARNIIIAAPVAVLTTVKLYFYSCNYCCSFYDTDSPPPDRK